MILTGRHGNVEVRASGEWPGFKYGANPLTVPPASWRGGGVDRQSVSGVPAANNAVRIASEQVAGMNPGVYRGDGLDRVEVKKSWQARFFADQPNDEEPWDSVWQQTEASLTAENNAYWWLVYDAEGRVAMAQVVDPCLVRPKREKGRKMFEVSAPAGKMLVGPDRILHFRGYGNPGDVAAANPIDVFATAFGAAVARQEYESGFYERGLGQSLAVTLPGNAKLEQVREFQKMLQENQGGVANAHKARIFTGGATVQTIGISLRDAQFIEANQFTVDEVARIYNVLASLLGAQSSGGSTPITPEHELTRWLRFGLAPRLRRIAAAINHHPAFFGAGARDEFDWSSEDVLKGDVATEDLIAHNQTQDGRVMVDEWRATKGLPPLPGGVGSIPQIVPVGGAPNPVNVTPTGNKEPDTELAAELES